MRFPPSTLIVATALVALAQSTPQQRQAWDRQHPDLVFWRDNVQIPLTRPNAPELFENNYRDAGLPPDVVGFKMFTARVVSLSPGKNRTEIVVEMSDPNDPNPVKAELKAKLLVSMPLPSMPSVGTLVRFKGAITAYQKDPLQLTFTIDRDTDGKLEW